MKNEKKQDKKNVNGEKIVKNCKKKKARERGSVQYLLDKSHFHDIYFLINGVGDDATAKKHRNDQDFSNINNKLSSLSLALLIIYICNNIMKVIKKKAFLENF